MRCGVNTDHCADSDATLRFQQLKATIFGDSDSEDDDDGEFEGFSAAEIPKAAPITAAPAQVVTPKKKASAKPAKDDNESDDDKGKRRYVLEFDADREYQARESARPSPVSAEVAYLSNLTT